MKLFYFLVLFFLIPNYGISQEKGNIFDVARKGTVQQIKKIYKKNPKCVLQVNENGFSALVLAIYKNNNQVAKYLIDKGSDINQLSDMGSPFMAAVVKGNIEIAKVLLEKKANIDLSDPNGVTALMYAAQFQNVEITKLLLQHNVNKTLIDKNGKTAFEYAVFSKNEEIINLLK